MAYLLSVYDLTMENAVSTNSTENRKNKSSNSERIDLRSFIPDISPEDLQPQPAGKKTLATALGEIVWLFSQSPLHRHLKIADLEWALMPALILDQYKIYKANGQVAGVALWAYLNEEAEKKVIEGKRLDPRDWGNGAMISMEEGLVPTQGGQCWLIDIVVPYGMDVSVVEYILNDLIESEVVPDNVRFLQQQDGRQEVSQ